MGKVVGVMRRMSGTDRRGPARHRRFIAPLLASLLLAGCTPPRDSGEQSTGVAGAEPSQSAALADSLLESWLEAAGGMTTWDSIRSARYTVTTVWYDSAGQIRRMRPRRVELRKTAAGEEARVERPEAEGLYVQVFTGDTSWAALNGQALPPEDPVVAESEYVGRDVFYWFGLPFKLFDPGVHHTAHELPEGGYEVSVSFGDSIGAHPGDRYFYYFLDEDPYPEEVHYIEQGKEARDRTLWNGIGNAGAFFFVATRRYVNADGLPTKELRIDDVSINPELPDSVFRPSAH